MLRRVRVVMRRREFAVLFGASLIWPSAAMAQGRTPRIAVLALGNPNPEIVLEPFRAGLRDLGYIEGQNIQLEIRSAGGDANRLSAVAAELVAAKPDMIIAFQTPAATAVKEATQDIPIVLSGVGDPIGTGLISSLARPGGNITGLSSDTADIKYRLPAVVRSRPSQNVQFRMTRACGTCDHRGCGPRQSRRTRHDWDAPAAA
jgi:putative ABC transport system substrate-binding protein